MKLYFEFLSIHIKKAMQYKASFLLSALAQLFIPLTCFWGVQFMFMRFNQVYWMRNPTTYRLSVGGTFFPVKT